MNKQQVEKLERELMTTGYQLLHDAGVPVHTRDAQRIVTTWARTEVEPLARRLGL